MMKIRKKPGTKSSRGDMLELIKRAQSLIERSISLTEFAPNFSHAGWKKLNFSAGLALKRYKVVVNLSMLRKSYRLVNICGCFYNS